MQLGPTSRQPASRIRVSSAASRARPSASHSLNPALMTQIAGTFLSMQSSTASSTRVAGTTTMARSTGPGISITRGYAVRPSILERSRVDGHERSRKPRRHKVVQDLGADLAAFAICADDGDHPRLEKRLHRRRRRGSRPSGRLLLEALGDRQRDGDMKYPVVDGGRERKPRVPKDVEHPTILAQHVGVKGSDALVTRDVREAFQQARAQAVALHRVGDGKCHFGAFGCKRIPVEAGEGHDSAAGFGHQRRAPLGRDQVQDAWCAERRVAQEAVIQAFAATASAGTGATPPHPAGLPVADTRSSRREAPHQWWPSRWSWQCSERWTDYGAVVRPNFSIRYRIWSRFKPSRLPARVWLPALRRSA